MKRYCELKLLLKAGKIANLRLQVPYKLEVNGQLVCRYVADFVYEECPMTSEYKTVVEDTKGFLTSEFKLKRKLFKAIYGMDITCVYADERRNRAIPSKGRKPRASAKKESA